MSENPLAGVQADLTATSTQISSQVRSIVLGVLAFAWLFISGAKDIPRVMTAAMPKTHLILVAMLGILALTADLLQYVFGFLNSRALMKANKSEYDDTACLYRLRIGCFWIKQVTAVAAVVWLLLLLGRAVLAG